MRSLCRILIAVGLVAALAGCQPLDLRALDGSQWRTVSIANVGPLPARPPMITFRGRGASGSGTCSTFSITSMTLDATVKPARLTFDDLTSTSSDCPEQLRRVDEAFLQALARTQSIRLDGGRLVLDGPGGTLVFERVVGDSSDST